MKKRFKKYISRIGKIHKEFGDVILTIIDEEKKYSKKIRERNINP